MKYIKHSESKINNRAMKFQTGLSLIEIMVGIAIGLLVILVIMQVWSTFEDYKNRTASGSSAQESGLLALTLLEQDIRSAGAGMGLADAYACTTLHSYYQYRDTDNNLIEQSSVPGYSLETGLGMIPVKITDGGTKSDKIDIKKSSDFTGTIPSLITKGMPDFSAELKVSSVEGFSDGDLALMVNELNGSCVLFQITQVQTSSMGLVHNSGGTPSYNPDVSTLKTWPGYPVGAKILKIGSNLVTHSFYVKDDVNDDVNLKNKLIMEDSVSPSTVSILAGDIVKLKAQYGISAVGSQDVSQWVSATAATGWNTLDAAKIKRIKAVRLVIVARSSKMESSDVTDSIDTVTSMAGLIDLSSDPNWKRYRYRVYQTIIPIRNIIWAGV